MISTQNLGMHLRCIPNYYLWKIRVRLEIKVKKLVQYILTIMLLVLFLSGCGKQGEERYEASFLELFDTVTKIVAYADSKETFTTQVELVYDELETYHQLYDIYHDYEGVNNIKTINDQAGIAPVKVDQKIIDLLFYAKDMYELTNGELNIAFGSVLRLWHDERTTGIENPEEAKLPDMNQLQEMAQHCDLDQVVIDEENKTVYLKDPDMRLDVGAIAKGYATEMVSRYMIEIGLENSMISVGGNVRTMGYKTEADQTQVPWNVGIQNPDTESDIQTLYILQLSNQSLVTSGVYERYYTVDGKQYHHIIDKDTLFPADYFISVSIVTENSGFADVLSTALFNMSYDEGLALVQQLEGTEVLWIFPDGTQKKTEGFDALIKD